MDYIDDVELTQHLMREQEEFKRGERKMCSNELAEKFLVILEHYLTKSNVVGYTNHYKDEFRSKAYELFVKHWHKFDPSRARLNFYQKGKQLYLKEDKSQWRGGFGWFSLFCRTAVIDELNRFKKRKQFIDKILDEKNSALEKNE